MRIASALLGALLLALAVPRLLKAGTTPTLMIGGLGDGMSLFPVILAIVGIGLIAIGLQQGGTGDGRR